MYSIVVSFTLLRELLIQTAMHLVGLIFLGDRSEGTNFSSIVFLGVSSLINMSHVFSTSHVFHLSGTDNIVDTLPSWFGSDDDGTMSFTCDDTPLAVKTNPAKVS
jgi:hypothetical protein